MKGYRLNARTHDLEPIPGYETILARRFLKAAVQLQRRGVVAQWLWNVIRSHRLGALFAHLRAERKVAAEREATLALDRMRDGTAT